MDSDSIPSLADGPFLTDGGLETYLIFHRGLDLPEFAAFDLLKDEAGREELRGYYRPFLELAADNDFGFILESPTWRANPRWGAAVGYDETGVARANREAIELLEELRGSSSANATRVLISGCIGPHDDGYSPGEVLSAEDAEAYHSLQAGTFAETAADMISAITMTYTAEAIGVARAATSAGLPVAISFTVETDGRLPSGQALGEAIDQVDNDPDSDVAYFMINCAHPTHFESVIEAGGPWLERVQGVRANASRMSHAELDQATELDDGDPDDLAARYVELRERMPNLNVLGGCCGTDYRHVSRICAAVRAAQA